MSWTVADVMTRDPVVAGADTPIKEVAALLAGHRIGCVPVVDAAGRPIGIVTEDDLAMKAEPPRQRALDRGGEAACAGELMTAPLKLLTQRAPIAEAARILHRHRAHALLIVDHDGRLAGILTKADVLKVFLRPDAELRADVERCATPGDKLSVEVVDGLVVLDGLTRLRSSAERLAAQAAAVPGVVGVENRLRYRLDDHLIDHVELYP